MSEAITVGALAPDFEGVDQTGKRVRLASFRGKQAVVLYFYPKDDTPVCTIEACGFRDAYQHFVDAGAVVIGVSGDDDASHRRFADKHALPFVLLSDADRRIRDAYGVKKTLGLLDGRVTFVIDKDGRVRLRFQNAFNGPKHVAQALAVLRAGRA
jgi:peroxiredoxin Q/BCP